MKNFIYFHGYGSNGPDLNNKKVQMFINSFGYNPYWIDATKDYSPISYLESFNQVVDDNNLDLNETIFVGTSLGGYWAREFCLKSSYGFSPFIIFNPVIDPYKTLGKLRVPEKRFYMNFHGELPTSDIDLVMNHPGLVILAENDPIVSSKESKQFFEGKNQVVVLEGESDHRLLNRDLYEKIVRSFLDHLL